MNDFDQRGKHISEYICIEGGLYMRAKVRTPVGPINIVDELSEWNFDDPAAWPPPRSQSSS